MTTRAIIEVRFEHLLTEVSDLKRQAAEAPGGYYPVDPGKFLEWKVKASHLINLVCGAQSQHFKRFSEVEKFSPRETEYERLVNTAAVFMAAKEDYECGVLNSIRNLMQADVFDSELEQAEELMRSGYMPAAAVTAGVVLETTLRQMCSDAGLPIANLNTMNAELAKAGVYNKLVQKNVTAWSDIRNNAAHGHFDQFTREDVGTMIAGIRRFVTERLSGS